MSVIVVFYLSAFFFRRLRNYRVGETNLIPARNTMDKRSKITGLRYPASTSKAFASLFPLLSPCSSSSCCCPLPEIGRKKRQFRSPRKDRDESHGQINDFSRKTWKILQTNSMISKDVKDEVNFDIKVLLILFIFSLQLRYRK